MGVGTLEFRTASTSIRTVNNSSYVSLTFPSCFLRHLVVDFTIRAKNPPHKSAFAKLNRHLILRSLRKDVISGASNGACSLPDTVLNDLKLSDTINFGTPRLLTNLLRLCKTACIVMLVVSSKCTARGVAQVYKAVYTFEVTVEEFVFLT